jgi:hypothetical protein
MSVSDIFWNDEEMKEEITGALEKKTLNRRRLQ